jgi:molecular chaperone Hsp33
MEDSQPAETDGTIVSNYFVRGRNVLLTEVEATSLFVDYYLHRKDQRLEYPDELDALFKDLLAAFVLHSVSRPRNEVVGWSVRYPDPLVSFFLVGDSEFGVVTGRVFTENVREGGDGEFFQELKRPGKPLHRSMVDFEGATAKAAVERYYAQSEQRPARFFPLGGDRYAFLSAHPDFDEEWFAQVTAEDVRRLHEEEETNRIETRVVRWACGCTHEKMLEVLTPVMQSDPEGLFGDEESIEIRCPRCAARYRVTREALEDRLARSGGE